jgi:hypothetical protein
MEKEAWSGNDVIHGSGNNIKEKSGRVRGLPNRVCEAKVRRTN